MRLKAAHALGIMPDYLRDLISFSRITGLVRIKGVTAREEPLKKTPYEDFIFEGDPLTFSGGVPGRISYKINHQIFASLWGPVGRFPQPLVDFNKTTGLIEFAGLDFDLPLAFWRLSPQSQLRPPPAHANGEEERTSELWKEFRKWRARYKNSAFITAVWEPLERLSHIREVGINYDKIGEIVSATIKLHYKPIALFRSLSQYMSENIHAQRDMEDEETDHHLNPFAVIQARLGKVTGFDGFFPLDMAFLNMMLPHWKIYFQETKKRMAKLVEDFCPEAPRIAQYLLETSSYEGLLCTSTPRISVHGFISIKLKTTLISKGGFDLKDDEPDLNKRVESEEESDSSGSEDQVDEDD
ncbi:hypothetical protein B0T18DRAFT_454059 [Schizothecium vesticola]|uniref:Uncharacterized protein n=1 Tax=Schizothecium vesticola TaxID=314040 RepID=A0AA40FAJ5_9PEZI|nr:hypothetical protein B0T18DRAFT_454059 [Schizothecium vesticola]